MGKDWEGETLTGPRLREGLLGCLGNKGERLAKERSKKKRRGITLGLPNGGEENLYKIICFIRRY